MADDIVYRTVCQCGWKSEWDTTMQNDQHAKHRIKYNCADWDIYPVHQVDHLEEANRG